MSFFFVRVDTDAGADGGVVGYGEACDSYGCSYASVLQTIVDDVFAPLLVGQPLLAVESLADRMRLFTRRRLGDQWVAVHARSALELALWDAVGKIAGRSVSSLIGSVREHVEVYASTVFLEEQSAADHVELLAPLLERGVTKVKLRVGPEWRGRSGHVGRGALAARPADRADDRRQRDLHAADGAARRHRTARTRRAVVRRAAAAGQPGGHRVAGPYLARADRLRRAPVRCRRRHRRHAPRAAARAAARRVHLWRAVRGSPHGAGRGAVRRARGAPRVRRADLAGRQPAPRGHRAGHPPHRVPAEPGRIVVHVRRRCELRPRRHRRRHRWPSPPDLAWASTSTKRPSQSHPYRAPGARVAGTVGGLPDRFVGDR